jgi:hypothetical protein
MADKVTRGQARSAFSKVESEACAIRAILRGIDLALQHESARHMAHFIKVQMKALEGSRARIEKVLSGIERLRIEHAAIFTPDVVASWTHFDQKIKDMRAMKLESENIDDWVAHRQEITELFGVEMPFEDGGWFEDESYEEQDPDAGFECDETIRYKLITAGSGDRIELGQKSVMAYVDGNMVKPHDKFSGERDEDSIHELFDRLEEIHLAPVQQVSYKMKIESVFKCLEGRARQDVIGFKGAATRLEYLELWRGLFRQYGVTAHDVARQLRLVNEAAPKSTDMRDMMAYMNVLNNAAVTLKRLGFPKDQIASSLWSSVKNTIPTHLAEYCRRKVRRFDEDYGSDVATWHSIDGLSKFDGFYSYILAYSITEASIRPDKPVLKVAVEAPADEEKTEEKAVCPAQVASEKNKKKADESGGDEPPAKKAKTEASQNPKEAGGAERAVSRSAQKPVCLLCKSPAHKWRRCLMTIDCRIAAFQRDGRCFKCMSQDHATEQCPNPAYCDTCKDPNDATKGRHHPALCYNVWGPPTAGRGRGRGFRGGGRGRGNGGGGNQDQNVGYVQDGQQACAHFAGQSWGNQQGAQRGGFRGGRNNWWKKNNRGGHNGGNGQQSNNWGGNSSGNGNQGNQNGQGGPQPGQADQQFMNLAQRVAQFLGPAGLLGPQGLVSRVTSQGQNRQNQGSAPVQQGQVDMSQPHDSDQTSF